jgi:hypothetical protein
VATEAGTTCSTASGVYDLQGVYDTGVMAAAGHGVVSVMTSGRAGEHLLWMSLSPADLLQRAHRLGGYHRAERAARRGRRLKPPQMRAADIGGPPALAPPNGTRNGAARTEATM